MSARTDGYCRTLIAVARTLPLSEADQRMAAVICWTACGGETTWQNYANDGKSTLNKLGEGHGLSNAERAVAQESLMYPHDAVGRNLDSVGILQQRPSAGWGTVAKLMDVSTAFRKFFEGAGGNRGLLAHRGWQQDEAWHAAWDVQQCGPQDVHVYKTAAAQAQADVDRLWTATVPLGWWDTVDRAGLVAAIEEAIT